jgi:hypothetical protein
MDKWIEQHKDDRAEEWLRLRIGTVLRDEDGQEQIFIGWRRNTVGHEMIFCEVFRKNQRVRHWSLGEPRCYHASYLGTLCRKFPDLKKYVKISLRLRRDLRQPTLS